MTSATFWPEDLGQATLLGRIDLGAGPLPVLVRNGRLEDLSRLAPTCAHLLARFATAASVPAGVDLGPAAQFAPQSTWEGAGNESRPRLLAPVDLQCVKAAGVTFAVSTLERVIEELSLIHI